MRKILLVHGIDDTWRRMRPLQKKLLRAGFEDVHGINLIPNDGSISIAAMGRQVLHAVSALRRDGAGEGVVEIDLVGYSMGSLVCRYFIQRLGGKHMVHRFISLSGPHHGTITSYFRNGPAIREMRPGSELLRGLNEDPDPWGDIKVFSYWTPLDLMVFPAGTARLKHAHNQPVIVLAHPLMIRSRAVLRALIGALS